MKLALEKLMQKIALPKKYFSNEFIITDKFNEESEIFIELLGYCDGTEFNENAAAKISQVLPEICSAVKANQNSILEIIKQYENADLKAAQEEFDILMRRIENDMFISSIDDYNFITTEANTFRTRFRITPGSAFFRVRPVEYESSDISQNPDELFHIPLSKRANSNNERFSLAGFPSLYLSTMLPLAWQECGYPQKYYYSEFQYKYEYDAEFKERLLDKELRFLSLYSPSEIRNWGSSIKYSNFDLWLEVIMRYLKTYPLVLACSFVNQSGKVPYKQEYIIPQMLMQWVQRNKATVQGISYFTCVDMSMWSRQWCAYNIVIPATAPFDDKMYSQKLRDDFCWTAPHFFTVPLADKRFNSNDRIMIENFISDIISSMGEHYCPQKIFDILDKMINVSGCLNSLLEYSNERNMAFALHMLNSIDSNYNQLKAIQIDEFIREAFNKEKDSFTNEASIDDASDVYKNLYNRFTGKDENANSIGSVIDKYKSLCWNCLHPSSHIIVIFSDSSELTEPLIWLHEKHILYLLHKLSDDDSVEYLKKIASETKTSIQDFWDIPVGDDEWMKANIDKIKTPLFLKQNNVSIFSPDGTDFYGFLHIGFDKDTLAKKLHI